jgi:hypothetical protein
MHRKIPYSRTKLIISGLVLLTFLFARCVWKNDRDNYIVQQPDYSQFVGSVTCGRCHANIYTEHRHTAHYLTSRPASEHFILGPFDAGKNSFLFTAHRRVVMEKRKDGYYQVEYDSGRQREAERFDISVGSGTKGQSYLYWKNGQLFQLPIGYFTEAGQWSNSPGYPDQIIFDRQVGSRCLECHMTYAQTLTAPGVLPAMYDTAKMIYGIDCERCHGPGAQHVDFHTRHPDEARGRFILNPDRLSRLQSLNLCTLCHGGKFISTQPAFSFQAGDTLSNYFALATSKQRATSIDVHGNQYGLLAASKCFRMSQLTCVTCHNVHQNEAGKIALFSSRCQACHSEGHEKTCKLTATLGNVINQNCIDCHMPRQKSRAIMLLLQGDKAPTAAVIRSHYIKIYPEESKRFLAGMGRLK